jgi:hypothetical protein
MTAVPGPLAAAQLVPVPLARLRWLRLLSAVIAVVMSLGPVAQAAARPSFRTPNSAAA